MIRITTRILIPVSIIGGLILISQGTPENFLSNQTIHTIEGKLQDLAMGPVAALEIIKHLGTNGGGFFGANSTTPFENPTIISDLTEMYSMMILPGACVITLVRWYRRERDQRIKRFRQQRKFQSLENREELYLQLWQLSLW